MEITLWIQKILKPDELLERAQKHDPQALADLHTLLYPQVYRYVIYRLEDPQTCEDIVSEVFVRLIDVLRKKNTTIQSIRAWLLGTANHLVQDHYRRYYRRKMDSLEDHYLLPGDGTPEHEVDQHGVQAAVRKAIQRLTDEQQHVLALRFSQELSLEETAQVVGKSTNAVKALQFRALAALRKELEVETL